MSRKSKGRQKIQMTRMSKESNLLVTFSKRRSGLFKKASELSTLCGVEIAIIVFSPGKKVFSFGHPCVVSIVDRFLTRNTSSNSSSTLQLVEAHRSANVRDLNFHLTEILNQLEIEKKRGEELSGMGKANQRAGWWEAPIDELGLEELEQLNVALEELKKSVVKQGEKIMLEATNPAIFLGASSSSKGGQYGLSHVDMNMTNLRLSVANPQGFGFGYNRGLY